MNVFKLRGDDESWLAGWLLSLEPSMSIDIIEPRISCLATDVLRPAADS